GFKSKDAFGARRRTGVGFFETVLAMAIWNCWHIILCYAVWITVVTVLYMRGWKWIAIPNTLLTVLGTVLGFVVTGRAGQSFQRYNEGRKLWAAIILSSRTFVRTLWFQVSNKLPLDGMSEEEQKARALMEKKTIVNLVEAYSVAIKHYLRGEDGIYYTDLYHLVKFLPAYAMPAGIVENLNQFGMESHDPVEDLFNADEVPQTPRSPSLPMPATSTRPTHLTVPPPPSSPSYRPSSPFYSSRPESPRRSPLGDNSTPRVSQTPATPRSVPRAPPSVQAPVHEKLTEEDEVYLIPGYKPPNWHILELWPFSYLKGRRIRSIKNAKGERARKIRAKMLNKATSHNIPLEISLYLGSYIAALQRRKTEEPMTINALLTQLNAMINCLTGLERILTTPIPSFRYRIHIWVFLCLYMIALPLEIVKEMKWYTIPGVILVVCAFFGFLVAAEEIERYEKNDLNLDHFTRNIIRNELHAITSIAPPDPAIWAFVKDNDLIFAANYNKDERLPPEEWVRRGYPWMQAALRAT
ncbi:hypothetical protein FISHEDRAFT_54452, partial [Fistulina hepatica ATCC 64428]